MSSPSPRPALRQLRASAGSGKTHTLTQDVLELLARSSFVSATVARAEGFSGPDAAEWAGAGCRLPGAMDADPPGHGWPEIVAVTFTNRAATEMKERVLARLKDAALGRQSLPSWTRERAAAAVEELLRDLAALNMRTIDSLLHLLVRLAALDLGLPPDFEPVFAESDLFAPLLDDLAERARQGDPELTEIFSRACREVLQYGAFNGFLAGDRVRSHVMPLASRLLLRPEEGKQLAGTDAIARRLESLCANLRQSACALAETLKEEKLEATAHTLNALAFCTNSSTPDADLPPPSRMLRKKGLEECLKKSSRDRASDHARALYSRLAADTRALDGEGDVLRAALRHAPFVRLAQLLVEELPDYQRRTARIPAALVPALARATLTEGHGVSEAFCRMGSRLTHILVDEFQDTSKAQWEALQPLALEALARNGSLTLVGDVKQAIYGWRGGDAALFDQAPHDAALNQVAGPPQTLPLGCNWRSHEVVVAWNNAVFSRLGQKEVAEAVLRCLLKKADGGQDDAGCADTTDGPDALLDEAAALTAEAFADAAQHVHPAKTGGLVRLTQLPPPEKSGEADRETKDSLGTLLTERVLELGRRWNWGRICVLARTNDQMSLATSWLLAAGVPVVTQGSLLLAEQPLIAETVALLAFLNAPEDNLAFWTVLAGEALLPREGLPGRSELNDWAANRNARRGATLADAFRRRWPALWQRLFAPLHDSAGLLTPYDTVHEIFQRWQVARRYPQSVSFLLRFLEVVHLAEQEGRCDLAGFLDYWNGHGGEEKAPLPESMDAVRIMTIHKAKGLEFDAVVVPWHDFPIRARSETVYWQNAEGLAVLAPLRKAMGAAYRQSLLENAREALHLLYVAWTRAVAELHCFLPAPDSSPMAEALEQLLAPLREHSPASGAADDTEGKEWVLEHPIAATPVCRKALEAMARAAQVDRPEASSGQGADPDPESAASDARKTPVSSVLTDAASLPDDNSGTWPDDAARAISEELPPLETEDDTWRPMDWLPRLKIFRSPLPDRSWNARRRGTLLHHCLERLRITGRPAADAAVAVRHGLDTFPLPVPDREAAQAELTRVLTWFAGLPDAARWLACGTPEHTLLDERGGAHRVDLLVDDGEELVAVEYKSGTPGPLPAPEHRAQLSGYLDLLRRAGDRPCRGALVYLDRQRLIAVAGGPPLAPDPGAPVSAAPSPERPQTGGMA